MPVYKVTVCRQTTQESYLLIESENPQRIRQVESDILEDLDDQEWNTSRVGEAKLHAVEEIVVIGKQPVDKVVL